ncbi:MAG: adenylate/guanylate cyclase domain-containing protein [bacterium]
MGKPRFTLRRKLLFFSVLLAIIPLGIAGRRMITITQDELKSAANDELSITADKLAEEIDNLYMDTWRAPLLLIRNGIDDERLGVQEKVSLLTTIQEVVDIVSLQLNVDGVPDPMLVTQDDFTERLKTASLDPTVVLKLSSDRISELQKTGDIFVGDLTYVAGADAWLVTIIVPLKNPIRGRAARISARISLDRLRERIETHPFTKTGLITLVDIDGKKIFDPERSDLNEYEVVEAAIRLLKTDARAIGIQPYTRPSGEKMLGAFSFPMHFDWAVISERSESDAYLAVSKMFKSLMFWVLIGLSVAVAGAVFFAQRISRPILEVGKVAQKVGGGNFHVRVSKPRSNDEISDLGNRINEMIEGLRERFELQKFVSGQTMDAIKKSDKEGMKLGGERRNATVFISDIRGFTAFSEKVEPEVVIDMLNTYLRCEAEIVKKHHGDIDKYVGDELVAVFQDEDMVKNAALCAVEIQKRIAELNKDNPEWDIGIGIGINTGDMIMGAMGSEERMDYTILGDAVNVTSRLCDAAGRHQTLLSESSYQRIADIDWIDTVKLDPIQVKGKPKPVQIYEVRGTHKDKKESR